MFETKMDLKNGVILTIGNEETADAFDDFLTENYYIFYDLKLHDQKVDFLFGFASSIERVSLLISTFERN